MTHYFLRVLDRSELIADDVRKSFSNSEEAADQARYLAAELSKAGDRRISNLVLVVDQDGRRICECRAS